MTLDNGTARWGVRHHKCEPASDELTHKIALT